jgi:hypothetical protein
MNVEGRRRNDEEKQHVFHSSFILAAFLLAFILSILSILFESAERG